jgi:hypothetical protein
MPLVVGYADGVKLVLVVPENPLQMAQVSMTKLDRTLSGASRGGRPIVISMNGVDGLNLNANR